MKLDIILYFNKTSDHQLQHWFVNFEGNNKLNFIKQFQNGMIELKSMMNNIKKWNDFGSFWKIVFKVDGRDISAVKSEVYLSNHEYVYLEYIFDFNWKKLNQSEIAFILINSFSRLATSLSLKTRKEINKNAILVNLESENLLNLKKFDSFKPSLNLTEDAFIVKKISYVTPIKYRKK